RAAQIPQNRIITRLVSLPKSGQGRAYQRQQDRIVWQRGWGSRPRLGLVWSWLRLLIRRWRQRYRGFFSALNRLALRLLLMRAVLGLDRLLILRKLRWWGGWRFFMQQHISQNGSGDEGDKDRDDNQTHPP